MEAMAAANDPLRLESQVCFPLYACAKEVVRRYREPLEPLGLTYTQYLVMMTLWEYGDMTEGTLGKILHLDSGTLTPLLKRLEKDRTVIMITKKPELMQAADRIVVLNHGKIEAIGRHNKLLKDSPTYRELQIYSSPKEVKNV